MLDNRQATVADYLEQHLQDAEVFRLVSAYFSIYGFQALAKQLCNPSLKQTKFLFGDPISEGNVTTDEKAPRTYSLVEDGLSINSDGIMQQSQLARQCADWVQKEEVEIRTITRSNFLHGKMYHTTTADGGGTATVGSSNFTRRGLGLSQNPNLEINLATDDPGTHEELATWFDKVCTGRKNLG